jgi:hemerythrin-like domain-containing protein
MADIEEARKACYSKLKPLADQLYQLPKRMTRADSKKAVILLNQLLALLPTINDPESTFSVINTQCIIMPLLFVYQSITKTEKHGFESVTGPWFKIMHFLLSNTLVKSWMQPQFTIQLVILFSSSIDQATAEEIKHLSVLCLSAALPTRYKQGRCAPSLSTRDVLALELQKSAFVPIASQSIMALLGVILNQQHQQLRLDAIRTLSQLLHDNLCNADTLAEFLPGIASKLCATIYRKSAAVENHQIICSALDALGEIIQAVMSDEINETLVDIHTFEDIVQQYKSSQQPTITSGVRDKAWYNKAKQNLRAILNEILQARLYPDWRTRLAFVEFAFSLLAHCSRTLDNCIQPLVEALVVHVDDPYEQVATTCQLRMHNLLSITSFQQTILPILKDDLYDWAMKFPQYIMARDEQEKSIIMSLMSGLILLLGDEAESVLSALLSRCSDGWIAALQMDMAMLEQQPKPLIELEQRVEITSLIYPKVRFKYIVSDNTVNLLTRLIQIIGKHCDLSAWVNHFMHYITDEPPAAYLVHTLVSGAAFSTSSIDESWVVDIEETNSKIPPLALQLMNNTMEMLTSSFSTQRTIVVAGSSASFTSSDQVLTVCLGLQIIGLASVLIEPAALQDQLITMLYPLLAHLGSPHVYIHTYALITLDTIATQCNLPDTKSLAIANMDYIINMISQQMSVLISNHARVPLVLKALIHVGGYATIAYLDDTVQEIYDALERYAQDDYLSRELCGVLFEIVQVLERQKDTYVDESLDTDNEKCHSVISDEIKAYIDSQSENIDEEYKSMEDIGKYFLDRQQQGLHEKLTLDKIMEQGNMPMDLPPDDEEEDTDKTPLSHEQELTKSIMDKASHFLTSSSPQLRSQILLLLTSGVSILFDHPQQLNQFIHNIWPSILYRINDPQNYVVLHTVAFIEKVSQVSTDFLSGKFEKDLWPQFKMLIRRGVAASGSSNYSVYSLYHRTQLSLLRTLGHIARYVPIRQATVKSILEQVKFYYDNEQEHEQLRQACAALYKALAMQQPDTVWLYEAIAKRTSLAPPSDLLDMFQVPEWWRVQPT